MEHDESLKSSVCVLDSHQTSLEQVMMGIVEYDQDDFYTSHSSSQVLDLDDSSSRPLDNSPRHLDNSPRHLDNSPRNLDNSPRHLDSPSQPSTRKHLTYKRYSVDIPSQSQYLEINERNKVEEWLSDALTDRSIPYPLSPKLQMKYQSRFKPTLKKSLSTPVLSVAGHAKVRAHTVPIEHTPTHTPAHTPAVSVAARSVTSEIPSYLSVGANNSTLSPHEENQIRRLVGDRRLILIPVYQASVHGFEPKVFHSLCDKRGPSVTIVTLASGRCFGIYTSVGWYGRGEAVNDQKAFFFRAKDPLSEDLKIKATQNDEDFHIYDDPDLGPFFGNLEKPTLRLFCKVYQSKSAQVFSGGPFEEHGGALLELMGLGEEGALDVDDVEVFDASHKCPPILERPWREIAFNDRATLIENIDSFVIYRPEFCQIDHINVLLMGPVESGKSSLFNTFESTFKGHITSRARTGNGSSATTNQFRRYTVLPQGRREVLRLQLCDTPGITATTPSANDLVYILDGHLQDRFQFPSNNGLITNRSPGFNSDTTLRDEIHCVALVLDATKIPTSNGPLQELHSKIQELKEHVIARDIPIRVILTKVDLACRYVEANLSTVYQSCTITDIVDKISTQFTLPRNHIYPVKCYEHEINQVQNIGILVLSAFQNIIYAAESFLEDRDSLHTTELTKNRSASNVSAGSGTSVYSRNRSASDLLNAITCASAGTSPGTYRRSYSCDHAGHANSSIGSGQNNQVPILDRFNSTGSGTN